jgi:HTH-like domain
MDVAVACRLLGVSRSGYYKWEGRPESAREMRDKELLKLIERIHAESRGSYGPPRVTAELRLGLGEQVNRKRVERLMRQAAIQGIYRRRGQKNLVNAAIEEDLVKRNFTADWPDALWLIDITEHPTGEGKLYCAAVMAAFSRRVIGWSSRSARQRPGHQCPFHRRRKTAAGKGGERCFIRTTERSTRPGLSGRESAMPGYSAQWERSVTAMTMP